MTECEPKILAFCSNSVFFFGAPAWRASPRKEKNWENKKLGLAPYTGRILASLGTREAFP